MVGDVNSNVDGSVPVVIRPRRCRVYPSAAAAEPPDVSANEASDLQSLVRSLRTVRLSGPKNTRGVSVTTVSVGSYRTPDESLASVDEACVDVETADYAAVLRRTDLVDQRRTTTSDVHAVARTLGYAVAPAAHRSDSVRFFYR